MFPLETLRWTMLSDSGAGGTGCPRLDCHVACSAETLASRTLLGSLQAKANVKRCRPAGRSSPFCILCTQCAFSCQLGPSLLGQSAFVFSFNRVTILVQLKLLL
ncbi:unnamed protein product [Rangifer tarandus platyrhynchus]|uniref:Uncharacterized protein n=1 Tax=Rangifer tarandus platyrhynchus TaxID=3082113 RepID=A0AC60A878_RANTA